VLRRGLPKIGPVRLALSSLLLRLLDLLFEPIRKLIPRFLARSAWTTCPLPLIPLVGCIPLHRGVGRIGLLVDMPGVVLQVESGLLRAAVPPRGWDLCCRRPLAALVEDAELGRLLLEGLLPVEREEWGSSSWRDSVRQRRRPATQWGCSADEGKGCGGTSQVMICVVSGWHSSARVIRCHPDLRPIPDVPCWSH
jgi:hypothetical protein